MSQGKTPQRFPQPWPPTQELPRRLTKVGNTGQALGTPRELTVLVWWQQAQDKVAQTGKTTC